MKMKGFPGVSAVKNPPANAGDLSSISRSGKSPGVGNGNPLQYSCLENSMDRGAWRAAVHGVTKSWTWLSNWAFKNGSLIINLEIWLVRSPWCQVKSKSRKQWQTSGSGHFRKQWQERSGWKRSQHTQSVLFVAVVCRLSWSCLLLMVNLSC